MSTAVVRQTVASDRGRELYRAEFPVAARLFYVLPLGILLAVTLMTAFLLSAALASDPGPGAVAVISVLFLLGLGALVAVVFLWFRGTSMRMVLTTTGIEVRSLGRHWIPWHDVASIESSSHWYWSGTTVIRRSAGAPVMAKITAHRFSLLRGAPWPDRDPATAPRDTLIAIDAHRRYLRGEFTA